MSEHDNSEQAPLHGKHVLVVDDDPAVRRVLARILRSFDALVTEAGDGPEALGAITRARFDVILTDVYMSGVDGVAVLRAVRERDLDVAVILITGGVESCLAAEMTQLGLFDCVLKPFLSNDLLRTVVRAAAATLLAREKRGAQVP